YYGIWSIKYSYKIEQIINEKLTELKKVEKIYKGEGHLLVLSEDSIYSFNNDYYKIVYDIINDLYNYDAISAEPEYFLGTMKGKKVKVLFLKTEVAYFGIAGIVADFAEEERIILSSKLEQSQAFFEISAPKYYNWENLIENKAENFEKIIEILLQKEKDISKVVAIGKTNAADRGRDFEVVELVPTISGTITKKWLVQCKYSLKSISPNNISGWVERVIEHHYDGYWLITNNDITPTLFDQFKDIEKNTKYSFEVKFWQRFDLHIKMNLYNELFKDLRLFQE
ncbi:MAG: restriction endonuclease, partial [Bacteroidetes bacterium]|nr:restriction endonuclease [Bacteroidota bacterium]